MSSLWPPANFTEWPSTRIGALVINAIIILLLIIPCSRRIIFINSWKECCYCYCCCHEFWKALILGGLLGMFLHFIPCIWWTCDWGEYDGEAVRGAIWFISWPIIGLIILWLECHKEEDDDVDTKEEEEQQQQQQQQEEAQQVEDMKGDTDGLPA